MPVRRELFVAIPRTPCRADRRADAELSEEQDR